MTDNNQIQKPQKNIYPLLFITLTIAAYSFLMIIFVCFLFIIDTLFTQSSSYAKGFAIVSAVLFYGLPLLFFGLLSALFTARLKNEGIRPTKTIKSAWIAAAILAIIYIVPAVLARDSSI